MSRKFSNHVFWTDEDIDLLKKLYQSDVDWGYITAAFPGRSKSSISGKAYSLGIKRPTVDKMSDAERSKRKRESMAKRRAKDPVAARLYQKNYHGKNRDKSRTKMREYHQRRFFWSKAMKLRGETRATYKDLASMWRKQKGKCALSGRVLDRTSHIDHILPKARGGSDEKSNLQWLCQEVNLAKRNLTDAEFIKLCSDVIEWGSL